MEGSTLTQRSSGFGSRLFGLRLSALTLTSTLVAHAMLGAGLALTPTASAQAAIEDESDSDVMGYDAIVNQLNREADRPTANSRAKIPQAASDPFESVWIHFGVGIASLMQTVNLQDDTRVYLGQKGVQAALGIDLFSPNWAAEGTYRSFGESEDSTIRAALQEFELKIFYKDRLSQKLSVRFGGGLSGRYMTIHQPHLADLRYTTPSSVATAGLDFFMNDKLSIGLELSARSAMIGETLDRGSYDGAIRLDTHF